MASERMKPSQLNHRAWTAIVYLNVPEVLDDHEGVAGVGAGCRWDPVQDGGSLRCFVGAATADDTGETADEVLDIAPIGGRSVVFPSRELLHAVRPTHRRRLAMTAWIFDEGILQSEEMAEFVG